MKNLIIILTFLFSGYFTAQTEFTENQLVGKWIVKEVFINTDNKEIKNVMNGIIGATFNFKADKNFELMASSQSENLSEFFEMMNNNQWIFNLDKQIVKIGVRKNKYSVADIKLEIFQEKTYFILCAEADTPDVMLQVEKSN